MAALINFFVLNVSDQTTQIKIGPAGTNQVTEDYTFDPQKGLLTRQTAKKGTSTVTTLLDLSYYYNRSNSVGTGTGKKGHLTKIVDNLNNAKNREYEFDALGRLTKAKGGPTGNLWDQTYSYDRYGNRTNVVKNGVAADGSPIPMDGIPNLAYDTANNRITTTGFEYDVAGNQTKGFTEDGTAVKFEYDAANRLHIIKRASDDVYLQAFQFGSTNARLMDTDYATGFTRMFASVGGTVLAEYHENYHTPLSWIKSYVFLGERLLSTTAPNGTGGEYTEYNHPDKLSTRLITNGLNSYEQTHLPFGTALNAESTGSINRRFTSYDRSNVTGLDYAINRTYDSKQGRFTQVDPLGIQASNLELPQTLNLYSYCGNDPINHTDPDGKFFFSFIFGLSILFGALVSKKFRKVLFAVVKAIVQVLNNQWVQLGFFILDFILPGISKVASGLAKILKKAVDIYNAVSNAIGIAQIGAMIVEGQWKQLGVTLGLAAALAPLTAIAAGIKKGMQDALFSGSFDELADLFRGAWQGFKDGLHTFLEGVRRKGWEAFIPFYGNRCGPGHGDNPGTPGINSYDSKVCGWHDEEMRKLRAERAGLDPSASDYKAKLRGLRLRKIRKDFIFLGRSLIYGGGPHIGDVAFGGRGSIASGYKFLSFPSFGVRIFVLSVK